ncbi:P-loop containing nucleoside triphosphate hydrolase protein [Aspergillus cavernicola]|uniref:P-loop containing nucleoside triphosphate hydrolase protein n=1 Tax=Aspergillus cavernicola TaxID=176166 RepID=A0ABR4ISV0_9EURO
MQPRTDFKLVLLGDPGVGKTTFIQHELTGEITNEYHPTKRYTQFAVPFTITTQSQIKSVNFDVWDISGGHGRASTRAQYIKDADAAIIMFDLSNRQTMKNVVNWYRELIHATGTPIPFAVYGAKQDLDRSASEVNNPDSLTWPSEMGHVDYFQGSRKEVDGDIERPFLSLLRQLYNDSELVGFFAVIMIVKGEQRILTRDRNL